MLESDASAVEFRREQLRGAHYNPFLLPIEAIGLDLLSDSWAGREPVAFDGERQDTISSLEKQLLDIYRYEAIAPVFRGRFAEALLSAFISEPGKTVLTNGLFPTTCYHLHSRGVKIEEVFRPTALNPSDSHPFKGDLDSKSVLRYLESVDVCCIYIELCNNALGGHPVSMGNLKEISELAASFAVPIVLDGTRAFSNAYLIQQREQGWQDSKLLDIVRAIVSHSDVGAFSLTKDFNCPTGGFVGVRSKQHEISIRDLSHLMYGHGLSKDDIQRISLCLEPEALSNQQKLILERARFVEQLTSELAKMGVKVVLPTSPYAVFIDAREMLPHLSPEDRPDDALSSALFEACGVRVGRNLITSYQWKQGVRMVRLAFPLGTTFPELDGLIEGFRYIEKRSERIPGLRRAGGPPGLLGEYLAEFELVQR